MIETVITSTFNFFDIFVRLCPGCILAGCFYFCFNNVVPPLDMDSKFVLVLNIALAYIAGTLVRAPFRYEKKGLEEEIFGGNPRDIYTSPKEGKEAVIKEPITREVAIINVDLIIKEQQDFISKHKDNPTSEQEMRLSEKQISNLKNIISKWRDKLTEEQKKILPDKMENELNNIITEWWDKLTEEQKMDFFEMKKEEFEKLDIENLINKLNNTLKNKLADEEKKKFPEIKKDDLKVCFDEYIEEKKNHYAFSHMVNYLELNGKSGKADRICSLVDMCSSMIITIEICGLMLLIYFIASLTFGCELGIISNNMPAFFLIALVIIIIGYWFSRKLYTYFTQMRFSMIVQLYNIEKNKANSQQATNPSK